jgi:hypothetical protein
MCKDTKRARYNKVVVQRIVGGYEVVVRVMVVRPTWYSRT